VIGLLVFRFARDFIEIARITRRIISDVGEQRANVFHARHVVNFVNLARRDRAFDDALILVHVGDLQTRLLQIFDDLIQRAIGRFVERGDDVGNKCVLVIRHGGSDCSLVQAVL
jgi:hypothetical protein